MKNIIIAILALAVVVVLGVYLNSLNKQPVGANSGGDFLNPVQFYNEVTMRGVTCNTASWNPASIGSTTSSVSSTITLTGAELGDLCLASLSSATSTQAVLSCNIWAANTAQIQLDNNSATALDVPTGTARVCYFD